MFYLFISYLQLHIYIITYNIFLHCLICFLVCYQETLFLHSTLKRNANFFAYRECVVPLRCITPSNCDLLSLSVKVGVGRDIRTAILHFCFLYKLYEYYTKACDVPSNISYSSFVSCIHSLPLPVFQILCQTYGHILAAVNS